MVRLRKDHCHQSNSRTDDYSTEVHNSLPQQQQQSTKLPWQKERKLRPVQKVRLFLLHPRQCVQSTRKTLVKLFILLLLFLIFLGCCTRVKVVQVLGLGPLYFSFRRPIKIAYHIYYGGLFMDFPSRVAIRSCINKTVTNRRIYERIANPSDEYMVFDEELNVQHHKNSTHRPFQELPIGEVKQESLSNLISLELEKIPICTIVTWVCGMHRLFFPPDINLNCVQGSKSLDGKAPAQLWLPPNQVVVAHRKLHARLSNYSISHWEEVAARSNARNIGMILVGDEFNYGSSFLNDRLDGTISPFSFLIRDYYFEKLKNAEETLVVQLGSMTCKRQKLACSVAPPSVVFARLLAPGIGLQLRPTIFIKASQRSRKCFWAGSDRFNRQAMVRYFELSGGCEVYMSSGFNKGLNKTTYGEILANTVFGLVPRGNSFETHRLAEVLMFGGIPVMLDEAANAAHMLSYAEPIPLIHGATWKEAEQRMLELSDNDVNELQKRVLTWWDNYWNCVHDDMRWIMAQAHAVNQGRNLCNITLDGNS